MNGHAHPQFLVRLVMAWLDRAWFGSIFAAVHGMVWRGKAGRGSAPLGQAGLGKAPQGMAPLRKEVL